MVALNHKALPCAVTTRATWHPGFVDLKSAGRARSIREVRRGAQMKVGEVQKCSMASVSALKAKSHGKYGGRSQ